LLDSQGGKLSSGGLKGIQAYAKYSAQAEVFTGKSNRANMCSWIWDMDMGGEDKSIEISQATEKCHFL